MIKSSLCEERWKVSKFFRLFLFAGFLAIRLLGFDVQLLGKNVFAFPDDENARPRETNHTPVFSEFPRGGYIVAGHTTRFAITASDENPDDILTFTIEGNPNPLDFGATLEPNPEDPTRSVIFTWTPTRRSRYPDSWIKVTDQSGAFDVELFNFVVLTEGSDEGIPQVRLAGPARFAPNSPNHFEVFALSSYGSELEYHLTMTNQAGEPVELGFDWQSSNQFEVSISHSGNYVLKGQARSRGRPNILNSITKNIRVLNSEEIVPSPIEPRISLIGRGQIALQWFSDPANNTVTQYELILQRQDGNTVQQVVRQVNVPDPANEATSYTFVYDFADQTQTDLQNFFQGMQQKHITAAWFTINVIEVDQASTLYSMENIQFYLWAYFPYVRGIESSYSLVDETVTLFFSGIELPGNGLYSANLVRIYHNEEVEPIIEVPASDRQIIVPGVISGDAGVFYLTVVDEGNPPSVPTLEGLSKIHAPAFKVPQCHDGIDNNGDGRVDLNDPGCSEMTDRFEYSYEDNLDLRNRVLVIYNRNTTDSREIAEHYIAQRQISEDRMCGVQLPPGHYATAEQLLGARKTIVEECICNVIPSGNQPNPCDVAHIDDVARVSPITHLVLIRGIPARLTGTNWTDDEEDPSFDFFLSFALYRDMDQFFVLEPGGQLNTYFGGMSSDTKDFQTFDPISGFIRPINPSLDKMVAYGRIEAMDKERTFALIDRTVAAEEKGVGGNFLFGLPGYYSSHLNEFVLFRFFRDLTSSREAQCRDYLVEPYGEWPYQQCRMGAAASILGTRIPGEIGQNTIPRAMNAGIYLGSALANGHHAFDGFENMLNWHKTDYDCIELCKDFGDPTQVANCRLRSTDYFKEINTDCVGAADGFLGWQFRSWPVQYYGFFPPGWELWSGGNGSVDRTPPLQITAPDAYRDNQFQDDQYLHFGEPDSLPNPQCTKENGDVEPCPEMIGIDLTKSFLFNPLLSPSAPKNFIVRFRYRSGAATAGGVIGVGGYFIKEDNSVNHLTSSSLPVTPSFGVWQPAETTLTISDITLPIRSLTIQISASLNQRVTHFVDIDGVEVVDADTRQNILEVDIGSFNKPYIGSTHPGDYAANVIDRLGGIGWWGSSSHFRTGGYAFAEYEKIAGAFYSGKSLGESLVYDHDALSGIIYADPLYQPSGAKIYVDDGFEKLNDDSVGFIFHRYEGTHIHKIYINAFHGKNNLNTTNWSLSICRENDIDVCDASAAWEEFESGTNAVFKHQITTPIMNLIEDPSANQNLIMRLHVWNSSEPANDLKNYGYFHYESSGGDWDQDELLDEWEEQYFPDDLTQLSGDGFSDFDHDGLSDFDEWRAGTDPTKSDTDGDGLSDGDEVHRYHTNPTRADTDGDGISDGQEVQNGTDPLNPNDAPANFPPRLNPLPIMHFEAGHEVVFTVRATDVNINDQLVISIEPLAESTDPVTLGATITFDHQSEEIRTWTYHWQTQDPDHQGRYQFQIIVEDPSGLSDLKQVDLNVDSPGVGETVSVPILTVEPQTAYGAYVRVGEEAVFTALAQDSLGLPIDYQFGELVNGNVIERDWQTSNQLTLSWNEPGNHTMLVQARSRNNPSVMSPQQGSTYIVVKGPNNILPPPYLIPVELTGRAQFDLAFYSNPLNEGLIRGYQVTVSNSIASSTLPRYQFTIPVPNPDHEVSIYHSLLDMMSNDDLKAILEKGLKNGRIWIFVQAVPVSEGPDVLPVIYFRSFFTAPDQLPQVQNIQTTNITYDTADIDFEVTNPGGYYHPDAFRVYSALDDRLIDEETGTHYTLTGLTPNTIYENTFYIRPVDSADPEIQGAKTIVPRFQTNLDPSTFDGILLNSGNPLDGGEGLTYLTYLGYDDFTLLKTGAGDLIYSTSSTHFGRIMGRLNASKHWELWDGSSWNGDPTVIPDSISHSMATYRYVSMHEESEHPGGLFGLAMIPFGGFGFGARGGMDHHGLPTGFRFDPQNGFKQWYGGVNYQSYLFKSVIDSWSGVAGGGGGNRNVDFAFDPVLKKGLAVGTIGRYAFANPRYENQLTAALYDHMNAQQSWFRWDQGNWIPNESWPEGSVTADQGAWILDPAPEHASEYSYHDPRVTHIEGTNRFLVTFNYGVGSNSISHMTTAALYEPQGQGGTPQWYWWNGSAWETSGSYQYNSLGPNTEGKKRKQIDVRDGKVSMFFMEANQIKEVIYDNQAATGGEVSGRWGGIESVFSQPPLTNVSAFDVTKNADDTLWLFYETSPGNIYFTTKPYEGSWGTPQLLYADHEGFEFLGIEFVGPNLPVCFIAKSSPDGVNHLYAVSKPDNYWSGEVPLNVNPLPPPTILLDSAGEETRLTWASKFGNRGDGQLAMDDDGYFYIPETLGFAVDVYKPAEDPANASAHKWGGFSDYFHFSGGADVYERRHKVFLTDKLIHWGG
ncbi:MAG: hypothetical protein HY582_00215, partial [Candidatus Omnitrophica bacterium]|nr:hypothetical protein [Candidatus Omnitrophota bacterium]